MENSPPKPKRDLISSLPHDILFRIFAKLPVRSLLRLRCVSRSLHAVISSPDEAKLLPPALAGFFQDYGDGRCEQFAGLGLRTYADVSSIDTNLMCLPVPKNSSDLSLPPPLVQTPGRRLFVLHSSGGLLLLVRYGWYLLVCNPATRRWAKLSFPPTAKYAALALAFEARRFHHYKIVSFPCPDDPNAQYHKQWAGDRIEVFSSETGEWMEKRISPPGFANDRLWFPPGKITYLNGLLYAAVASGCALVVDLDNDYASWKIDSPTSSPKTRKVHCIGHSQGLLHYAAFTDDSDLLVWVLEDPWSRQYVLKHEHRLPELQGPHYVQLLAFHPDLDVVFLMLEEHRRTFCCHLRSGRLEELPDMLLCHQIHAYIPCYSEELDLSEDGNVA